MLKRPPPPQKASLTLTMSPEAEVCEGWNEKAAATVLTVTDV